MGQHWAAQNILQDDSFTSKYSCWRYLLLPPSATAVTAATPVWLGSPQKLVTSCGVWINLKDNNETEKWKVMFDLLLLTRSKRLGDSKPWCHRLSDLCFLWSGWARWDQTWTERQHSAPLHALADVRSHLSGSPAMQSLAASEESWHPCHYYY